MTPLTTDIAPFQFTPRSIRDRTWWQRVARDERTQPILEASRRMADQSPGFPEHPRASDFLAARRSNNRGIVDAYWQRTRGELAAAVLERCLDGRTDEGVDDHLLDVLWAFLTCPTWVVSAHLPGKDLPLTSGPQLDLAACEMAAAMAETLELIQPWIEAQSDTLAASMVDEIDRRVLGPFTGQEVPAWWCDPKRDWNNWAGVCAGSILAACEALGRLGQPRPEARAKAIDVLGQFIHKAFTPAGECDEGIGYWNYGVGFACLGWSCLAPDEVQRVVDMDRLRQVADYPRQVHLFNNTFYSGNDAPLHAAAPLFAGVWLGAMTDSPWLLDWSRQALAARHGPMRNVSIAIRTLDAALRLEPTAAAAPAPAPPARFITDQQALLLQSDRLTVCFAGGHNGEAHNHNDVGHFSVWVDKQLIVPDIGKPRYSADFFGPRRYEYLPASSRGHCCPLIDGHAQQTGKDAAARVLELDLAKPRLALDLTAAYPAEAHLQRWTRTLDPAAAGYQLVDTFETSERAGIEHVIWSTVSPEVDGDRILLGPLTLQLDPIGKVTVEPVDPAAHALPDFKETLYRIAVQYEAQPGAPLRIATTLAPATTS